MIYFGSTFIGKLTGKCQDEILYVLSVWIGTGYVGMYLACSNGEL